MNWNLIKGNWNEVSDQIKLTWGKFSEEDLALIQGKRDLLAELLSLRYGYEKLDAENKINVFEQRLKD